MQEVTRAVIAILIYFVICAATALVARACIRIPDELFRKILHSILLGSLSLWIMMFPTWQSTAVTAIVFAVLVWPILYFAERFKGYSDLVTERKSGELKSSLLIVFFMFAAVVAVCWGWLDDKLLALASVYAWGFGDAAAALVGKRYGKHKIGGQKRQIDGVETGTTKARQTWLATIRKKSVEGTLAMFTVSFLCVLCVLMARGGLPWFGYAVISMVVAAVSALVELCTPNGLDTITCPFAAMAVLLPMIQLFGGI